MVDEERRTEIQKAVRRQIARAIKQDVDGNDEALMKEVWEDLGDPREFDVAKAECRRIVRMLGGD